MRSSVAWLLGGIAVVLAAGAVLVWQLTGDDGPKVPMANAWVAPRAGDKPQACAKPCVYDPAKAFGSIDAAWDAVPSGATIRMRAGRYGAQTITGDKTKVTRVIGGDGGVTRIGTLVTRGDHLELSNVTGTAWDTGVGNTLATVGDNVTLRNVNLKRVWLETGNNQRWIGGKLGPTDNTNTEPIYLVGDNETGPTIPLVGTVIEGIEIHNNTNRSNPAWHLEMIRIDGAVRNTTIRNNHFHDNTSNSSTIFITDNPGTGPPTDVNVIGNRFGIDRDTNGNPHPSVQTQIPLITVCDGYDILENKIPGPDSIVLACPTKRNTRVAGNVAAGP